MHSNTNIGYCCVCNQMCEIFPKLEKRDSINKNRSYTIQECRNCGFRFVWPQPMMEELKLFYSDSFMHSYGNYIEERDLKKEHFRLKFKLINNYIKPPGRMLDIGCASGFLIEVALEQGWDAIGIDINTYFEKYLDLKLKGKVVYGTLQNVRLNDNFHLITMFDVLEHSLNPREDLLICKELLTSNGVIVVQIPCIDSIGAKTFRKYWYHYGVPAHLSYFSLKTFTKLVENIELEVVQHCWTKKLFSAKYLLFQLMTKYFSSLGTSMNIPVIENIKFGVPMSERLLIIRNRQIT